MIHFYRMRASAPCRAVEMTLKLLGLEYEAHDIDLMKGEQFQPEFLKLNPFHTVPTIVDDGFSLMESRAITTYLINQYAPDSDLYPKDPKKRALIDQYLNLDNGTIFAKALEMLSAFNGGHYPSEEVISSCRKSVAILDGVLANSAYVTGDTFTLADLSIVMTFNTLQVACFDYSEFANIARFESQIRKNLSPMYGEVNDEPLAKIKEYLKSLKASAKK